MATNKSEAELRLTGYIDGGFRNVILDRTFVDDSGIRWIVDYKAGSTDGNVQEFLDNEEQRYRDQLQMYKRIVSGFEERPIRLGLYFSDVSRVAGITIDDLTVSQIRATIQFNAVMEIYSSARCMEISPLCALPSAIPCLKYLPVFAIQCNLLNLLVKFLN